MGKTQDYPGIPAFLWIPGGIELVQVLQDIKYQEFLGYNDYFTS